MNKNYFYWTIPLILAGTTVSAADQDKFIYLDSTNRLTLSLRFGLNISAKFNGIGNAFTSHSIYGYSRRTPNGDRYNYDNGYVGDGNTLRADSTGNFLGYTSYWGYDNASQVNAAGFPANTVEFDRTTATGIPSTSSGGKGEPLGAELTYDRQFGEKENWHHMRYGLEAAANYMNFSIANSSSANATLVTTTTAYSFQSGDTPPAAPFQGTFDGTGYMQLQVPPTFPTTAGPTTVTPNATFTSHDKFNADIFGFRLGPYLEFPFTDRFELRASGGVAVGLIYGKANWNETLTPSGGPAISVSGSGSAFDILWGGYLSADATYQFSKRWGVDVGAQFQDIGKYNRNFGGPGVQLDLSKSIFIEAGVSYSF